MRFRFFVLFVPFLAAAATAAPPVAVSPGSAQRVSIVADNCPTFSWGSVAGAGFYELLVYRLGEDSQAALRQEVPGSALSWTPSLDRCLRPGARYAWAVRAIDAVGEAGRWSEPSLFEIAAVPGVEQVRSAMAILTAYLERLETAADAGQVPESAASRPGARSPGIGEGPEAAPRALAAAADTALFAASQATSGVAFGAHGVSKSAGAGSVGVAGESTATSGDVAGVYGQAASAAGAAGVFDNSAFGDILRGLAGGVELFTVDGTGGVTATGFSGDGAGLTGVTADSADDLDCAACVSAGELDFDAADPGAVETLTADWVNTANPWADDEVSDTLTVGASSSVDDAALSANVSLLGQTIESSEITDGTVTAADIADGSGSGLDADTFDTIESAAFLQKTEVDTQAELEALLTDVANVLVSTELDSEAELEALVGASLVSSTETAAAAIMLAANGGNCPAGQWAAGVDASGNAEGCTADAAGIDHGFATGNTRVGSGALAANTTGVSGTATGYEALTANTTGGKNTAIGARALRANTEGFNNTAIGESALRTNTTGTVNTASGEGALYANLTGSQNTATGRLALSSNTVGDRNTATGYEALANSTGSRNTGVGNRAGINATSGSDNIFLGSGAEGVAAEANTIRIGGSAVGTESGQQNRAFINGIRGVSVAGGQTVVIDAAGQLGSTGGGAGSGVHADTVDGFHASGAAAANTLLALDGAGKLPASITGDADTVDGKQAADLVAKAGDTMTGTLNLPANGLVAGTTQLVLEGGNVGIGTAVADEPLHVKGESTQVVIEDSMSGADRHLMQLSIGGGEATVAANHVGGTPSLGLKLQVRNSGAPLDAVKILPSGLVGIGDTTPTHRLDVAGDVTVGSEAETLANSGFALGGDDLFVAGSAGVEGTIYTDSGVTVGASTTFADGSITQSTNGSGLAIDVAGGDAAGEDFTVTANNLSISAAGAVTAASFSGVGSGLTGVAATTASSLSADGSNCVGGQFATGVDALGAAQGCSVPGDANHTFATENTKVGANALASVTTGASSTGVGFEALRDNSGGQRNTATGASALRSNTSGSDNTAHGQRALYSNLDGVNNVALGVKALEANIGGDQNTGLGTNALLSNTTGNRNTAVGQALQANSSGSDNTAIGHFALRFSTSGANNVAAGVSSMYANTTGYQNTAIGVESLFGNTLGAGNTAAGYQAVRSTTEGVSNTGLGTRALYSNTTGDQNTAVGARALYSSTGERNLALGYRAGVDLTTGSDNIHIGSYGLAAESATIKIGRQGTHAAAHVAGIYGTVLVGSPVVVTSSGRLGTASGATGNADTVDGFHATAVVTPNALLALDGSAKLPASITGDADTVDGKEASDFVLKGGDTMTGVLSLPVDGLAVGANQLFAANGRIGVGIANPDGGSLHVAGAGSQLYIEDTNSGADRDVAQLFMDNDTVRLIANHFNPLATPTMGISLETRNAGAPLTAMTLNGAGNVGIGDATPTHRLDVAGDVTVGSEAETLANAAFALGGDDLFVAGTAGVEGTIYTDSGVTVGASTTFADGSITQSTNGSGLAIDVAGGDAAGENFTVIANNISVSSAGALTLADDLTLSAGDLNLPEGAIQDARVVGADIKDGEIGEAKLNLTLVASGEVALAPGAEQEILVDSTYDLGGTYYPLYWVAVNRWRGNDYSGQKFAYELIHRVDSDYWNTKFYLHLTNLNATTPPAGVRYRVYRLD